MWETITDLSFVWIILIGSLIVLLFTFFRRRKSGRRL